MNAAFRQRVEERAYAIWKAEGQPHGRHEEHWQRAEGEIAAEGAAKPSRRRAPAAARKTVTPPRTGRRQVAAAPAP